MRNVCGSNEPPSVPSFPFPFVSRAASYSAVLSNNFRIEYPARRLRTFRRVLLTLPPRPSPPPHAFFPFVWYLYTVFVATHSNNKLLSGRRNTKLLRRPRNLRRSVCYTNRPSCPCKSLREHAVISRRRYFVRMRKLAELSFYYRVNDDNIRLVFHLSLRNIGVALDADIVPYISDFFLNWVANSFIVFVCRNYLPGMHLPKFCLHTWSK